MKSWTIIMLGYFVVSLFNGLPGGNETLGLITGIFTLLAMGPAILELDQEPDRTV